jgi:hypothetical protein
MLAIHIMVRIAMPGITDIRIMAFTATLAFILAFTDMAAITAIAAAMALGIAAVMDMAAPTATGAAMPERVSVAAVDLRGVAAVVSAAAAVVVAVTASRFSLFFRSNPERFHLAVEIAPFQS